MRRAHDGAGTDGDSEGPSSNHEEGHGLGQREVGAGVGEDLTWLAVDRGPMADGDPHAVPFCLLSQGQGERG